jgi:hypothetical protein
LLGRSKSAKGESIRKAGIEEDAETLLGADEDDLLQGVFLTYEDQEEAEVTTEGYRS